MKSEDCNVFVRTEIVEQAVGAAVILKKSGIGLIDAARLVAEFSECAKTKRLRRLRRIFSLGCETFLRERRSVTFGEAFACFLRSKSHLRERTRQDYRRIYLRVRHFFPSISSRKLNVFDEKESRALVDAVFRTPRQRSNAKAVLHAFFAYCVRHGWCRENPLRAMDAPAVREREIVPLCVDEAEMLLRVAGAQNAGECVPAVALMMFAGIRPREVERLEWTDIDWEEKVVSIAPRHSKTGGCRHVSILPRLEKILRERRGGNGGGGNSENASRAAICPPNWARKWARIRIAAGWIFPEKPWRQDVLRHTFASYHLKFFKNLPLLQCEMGHSSLKLLQTRYLSMRGITRSAAERFWNGNAAAPAEKPRS